MSLSQEINVSLFTEQSTLTLFVCFFLSSSTERGMAAGGLNVGCCYYYNGNYGTTTATASALTTSRNDLSFSLYHRFSIPLIIITRRFQKLQIHCLYNNTPQQPLIPKTPTHSRPTTTLINNIIASSMSTG